MQLDSLYNSAVHYQFSRGLITVWSAIPKKKIGERRITQRFNMRWPAKQIPIHSSTLFRSDA